ncbi:DUF3223 domain-containing protein [Kitasatospora sp. NPDC085895]|uniref:DUF3223 domain-containing protein n=1 Tax=Kitasatospora sp. NPDC085895 TaxID=3155057 RepID=UPI00344CE2D0
MSDLLNRYDFNAVVDQEEDALLLRDLLDMHPKAVEKIGPGVDHFRVIMTPRGGYKGPEAVHTDGRHVPFSYNDALEPPTHAQRVEAAMRTEVKTQRDAYVRDRESEGTLVSDESGLPVAAATVHVSYYRGRSFHDLATEFVEGAGGPEGIELETNTEIGLALFADRTLAARWHDFHREHAVLALLTPAESLRRSR